LFIWCKLYSWTFLIFMQISVSSSADLECIIPIGVLLVTEWMVLLYLVVASNNFRNVVYLFFNCWATGNFRVLRNLSTCQSKLYYLVVPLLLPEQFLGKNSLSSMDWRSVESGHRQKHFVCLVVRNYLRCGVNKRYPAFY